MVKAPFVLHTVTVKLHTGQAQGDKWYLAPFRLMKVLYIGSHKISWAWEYARYGSAQYIGNMSNYAGKDSWRRA